MASAEVLKLLVIFILGYPVRHVFCCVGSVEGRPSALCENGVK